MQNKAENGGGEKDLELATDTLPNSQGSQRPSPSWTSWLEGLIK